MAAQLNTHTHKNTQRHQVRVICRPGRYELVLVFMKATDDCFLVGKVLFVLAHCISQLFSSDACSTEGEGCRSISPIQYSTLCVCVCVQACFLYRLRVKKIFSFPLSFSAAFSHILNMYPHWSLIAMATSDFSCSLGPVLSLSNQNKTFVKIPSGSTYSTHYDELTLTLKGDRERTTARERSLQAISLYLEINK